MRAREVSLIYKSGILATDGVANAAPACILTAPPATALTATPLSHAMDRRSGESSFLSAARVRVAQFQVLRFGHGEARESERAGELRRGDRSASQAVEVAEEVLNADTLLVHAILDL